MSRSLVQDYILAPEGYPAYKCSGKCSLENVGKNVVPMTNHAIMQAMMANIVSIAVTITDLAKFLSSTKIDFLGRKLNLQMNSSFVSCNQRIFL